DQGDQMLVFIIYLLIGGLIVGFIARAIVPGRDPMSVGATIVLGIVGSFVGGFLGWALFGADAGDGALQASGIVGSIIGAVLALLVYRRANGRSRGGLAHR
ncbi:MAG: GlsB/YeaQ/YmgE family stress response membrane protein, partial [Acidimicrobiales bacterium]